MWAGNKDSLSKKDNGPTPLEFLFKPQISLGIGMMTFYGDIGSNHKGYHPTVSKLGYDLRLINPLTDYLDLSFYVLFGQISSNERTLDRNLNFNSNIIINNDPTLLRGGTPLKPRYGKRVIQ